MLRKASAKGELPASAKLTSQKERGAQNLAISTVDGWLIGEEQDFVIFETDSNNDIVPGSATSWKGVPASNGSIAGLTLTGGLDRLYPIGAAVVPTATSAWANDLVEWLLKSHNPDGTLKESAIPELKPQVIPDKSITADKIDFTTIPAYNYSSEEINTGHKWVNKKPIYQKSITFNTTGSGAEETGANNENFNYIDTLISLDAILNMPNGERYPNSYTNPSAPSIQYFQLKFANWNNAQVLRYQTRSVGTVTMTIRYTKK